MAPGTWVDECVKERGYNRNTRNLEQRLTNIKIELFKALQEIGCDFAEAKKVTEWAWGGWDHQKAYTNFLAQKEKENEDA